MNGASAFRPLPIFVILVGMAAPAHADSLAERRAAVDEAFHQQLTALAAKCDELGLQEQAHITRAWYISRDPSRHYVFLPPAEDAAAPPAEAEQLVRFWHGAWMKVRRAQAATLFAMAKSSLEQGDVREALLLIHETLHEDPAHERAPDRVVLDVDALATAAGRGRLGLHGCSLPHDSRRLHGDESHEMRVPD